MRIQVCSNEGPNPFSRGIITKKLKIHWWNLKIFISRTSEPISTKFGKKHPWLKGIQVCSNKEPFTSHIINNWLFLLLISIMIIICVYWFKLFSQVSVVAHGPLVYCHWHQISQMLVKGFRSLYIYLAFAALTQWGFFILLSLHQLSDETSYFILKGIWISSRTSNTKH